MVLVEEAKAGGTPRRECPRDDHDIRSLAGVARPASVTVYDDSLGSPGVGGTLSSSDIARRLLLIIPAEMSFPVCPIPCYSPDDPFLAGGLVGRVGRMSLSDSDPAGPTGPYVAGGPVGPDGTLSPFISNHAGQTGRHVAIGPVGPFGTLSRLCWTRASQNLASQADRAVFAIKSAMKECGEMTVSIALDLFDKMISPILSYGLNLY